LLPKPQRPNHSDPSLRTPAHRIGTSGYKIVHFIFHRAQDPVLYFKFKKKEWEKAKNKFIAKTIDK
jgi:hypothetical protein